MRAFVSVLAGNTFVPVGLFAPPSDDVDLEQIQQRAIDHMAAYDKLGPVARRAIWESRFDPLEPHELLAAARQMAEDPKNPTTDAFLAARVTREDNKHSGLNLHHGQPPAPKGI